METKEERRARIKKRVMAERVAKCLRYSMASKQLRAFRGQLLRERVILNKKDFPISPRQMLRFQRRFPNPTEWEAIKFFVPIEALYPSGDH